MLNYIRSELYRITHTRAAFLTTAILSAGILAINLVLHFWGGGVNYYGHTSFSYALNISEPFLYVIMGRRRRLRALRKPPQKRQSQEYRRLRTHAPTDLHWPVHLSAARRHGNHGRRARCLARQR